MIRHLLIFEHYMKKAFLQLHIAVLLAGFTGIFGKLIHLNAGLLVWYRMFISSVSMWILFSFLKKLTHIPAKDKLILAGIGGLAGFHWVTFYASIQTSNVSVGLVCFSSVGFFTALFEPLIFKKRIDIVEVLLGLIVIAGIYIVLHFNTKYTTGIILGVISAMLIAIVIILLRPFSQRMNAETLLTWQLSGGVVILSVFLPFYLQRFPVPSFFPSLRDWMWLVILAWFCSVLAFQLSIAALRKLTAFTVNLTYNLEPVYGIALAFALFGENKELRPGFYYGFALIVLAVCLQTLRVWYQRRSQPVSP